MKASNRILALLLLCGMAITASADVLILKDGQAVSGKFQGGDPGGITFLVNGEYRRYQLSEIQSITILPSMTTTSSAPPPAPASTQPTYSSGRTTTTTTPPAPYPSSTASGSTSGSSGTYSSSSGSGGGYSTRSTTTSSSNAGTMGVTVPSGTVLTVRMIDPVDSGVNQPGEMFRATLDEPLVVNGRTIASRGTYVNTKLVTVEEAGRIQGRSELALILYDITINGRRYEITTEEVSQQGASRGTQSAQRIGGLAAIGAVIGAIAGGGKGAAQGAAAGAGAGTAVQVLTHGENVKIPAESRLEFTLAQPLNL